MKASTFILILSTMGCITMAYIVSITQGVKKDELTQKK